MKTLVLSATLSLFLLSLSSSASAGEATKLPSFSELHPNVQADILDEIGTTPMIVEDISDLIEGFDGSYVGLYKKEGKTYSFRVYVVFATQGGTSAMVTESKEVKGL